MLRKVRGKHCGKQVRTDLSRSAPKSRSLEAPAEQEGRWPAPPCPAGPTRSTYPQHLTAPAPSPFCRLAQLQPLGARGGAGGGAGAGAGPRRAGTREARREGVAPREAARGGGREGRVLEAELRAGTGSFAAIFCPTKQPIGDGSQPGLHWRFVSRFGQ